jgi:uncharacterized protein YqjF (DUF2071 family)
MSDFNKAILNATAHRPWPMPRRPWLMMQTWHDLLFAHWAVDPQQLRAQVPTQFELDLWDGHAWVGIVPFRMSNVAPRGVPALPWLSAFPELNVRTYVRVEDRPGIYFFSLDAGRTAAVYAARAWLNLPYYSAAMSVQSQHALVHYHSERPGTPSAVFTAAYGPAGPALTPDRDSLTWFLTERYCLYHVDHRGAPYRLEIHHPPWMLQPAHADIRRNTMAVVNRLSLPPDAPLLHFARRQDMVAWGPQRLGRTSV